MTSYTLAQLRTDLTLGVGMALGFTLIAALPLGLLGVISLVEAVQHHTPEIGLHAYEMIVLVVPGSYFVGGFFGGFALFLLRPLRRSIVGWIITGAVITAIAYGTVGLALAVFYDPVGKVFLEDSTRAETWEFLRLSTPIFAVIGAAVGAWWWWKDRRKRALAGAPRVAHVSAEPPIVEGRGGWAEWRPSWREVLVIVALALTAWARYTERASVRSGSSATSVASRTRASGAATPPLLQYVDPVTDSVARRFAHLLETRALDSAARLLSPTAHIVDSVAYVRALSAQLPAGAPGSLERTLAVTAYEKPVTRALLAYRVRTPTGSTTLVLQTVEELGVRWVERAWVTPGVVRTLDEATRWTR